jgi:2-polyprenyl-3-methyl-5-hydroxy-6-metoxy-1,4-benzoquinol methylase
MKNNVAWEQNMKLQNKLAESLSAQTTELIPYLPYLLQDLWELGGIPGDICDLLQTYMEKEMRVLDLACGKGALCIQMAKTFQSRVKGIDIMPAFIESAREMAVQYGVEDLCEFETDDINEAVERERGYDIVVLSAIGDVLGDPLTTLHKLRRTVGPGGFIVLDDVYAREETENGLTKADWSTVFYDAGVAVLAEKETAQDKIAEINAFNQAHIERRARELKQKHPELSHLFDGYVQNQQEECDSLENDLIGVLWLLGVS